MFLIVIVAFRVAGVVVEVREMERWAAHGGGLWATNIYIYIYLFLKVSNQIKLVK